MNRVVTADFSGRRRRGCCFFGELDSGIMTGSPALNPGTWTRLSASPSPSSSSSTPSPPGVSEDELSEASPKDECHSHNKTRNPDRGGLAQEGPTHVEARLFLRQVRSPLAAARGAAGRVHLWTSLHSREKGNRGRAPEPNADNESKMPESSTTQYACGGSPHFGRTAPGLRACFRNAFLIFGSSNWFVRRYSTLET